MATPPVPSALERAAGPCWCREGAGAMGTDRRLGDRPGGAEPLAALRPALALALLADLLAEDQPDRRPVKAVRLAQPVLQVAAVREVDRRRIRREEHERRRRDGRLGHVPDLRP